MQALVHFPSAVQMIFNAHISYQFLPVVIW